MTGAGYKTYFMGANDYEGVKTRRMLNAPISMDFKHTLRSYMTRENLDLRNMIVRTSEWIPESRVMRYKTEIRCVLIGRRIERWLDVRGVLSGELLNWQLNQVAEMLVAEAKPIFLQNLIQEYKRCDFIARVGNRRIATYGR